MSPRIWGQSAPRGCVRWEMGMATLGWVTCCRHSLGQSQGSHTNGKRYHKLCSGLCTSSAVSGPAQPWGPSRSSWGCHSLSAHAWFQSEMLLQHSLQLGINCSVRMGKCMGLGSEPTRPGVSSKALCQRHDAKRWGLWKGRGKLSKRCLTGLQWGEQATVAQSQWEHEWQKWFWASKVE